MSFAVTYDFTANTVISSTNMNTNFSDIETAINNIDDYIGTGVITAAMLATIATAGKVSGAALTALANTPSGAGVLPEANVGQCEGGDILLSSGAKTLSGWTEITSTYASKYIRVGATGLATGGNSTHTHTGPSHTHSVSGTTAASSDTNGAGGTGISSNPTSHTHTYSSTTGAEGTGNTGSANNDPLYIDLRLWQKD